MDGWMDMAGDAARKQSVSVYCEAFLSFEGYKHAATAEEGGSGAGSDAQSSQIASYKDQAEQLLKELVITTEALNQVKQP